jgi:SAM-dependent methyltransferase
MPLIYSVTGSRDVQWFLESGARSAEILRAALERAGRPLDRMERVLDMGCGCGRVLRQWREERGVDFYGTDYNPVGVQWVRENLTYVQADTNELAPPLRYPDNFFDAVYAISVFTHLPEELQRPWMEELSRVLKPGGILLATLLGEGFLSRFTAPEAARFRKGELVVIDAKYAGTNMCSALHPEPYVRGAWSSGFEILNKSPHDIGGPFQDLWTFREARKPQ